jgi:hypothetical protein
VATSTVPLDQPRDLHPRADVELAEDVSQVALDGLLAEEQLGRHAASHEDELPEVSATS